MLKRRRSRPFVNGPGPSNREPIDHPAVKWLMKELERRRLTRTNAATAMGLSQSHLSGVITGDKPLTLEVAARFVAWGMPTSIYWKTFDRLVKSDKAKAEETLREVGGLGTSGAGADTTGAGLGIAESGGMPPSGSSLPPSAPGNSLA